LDAFLSVLTALGQLDSLGMLLLGSSIGFMFGMLPGLGGTAALALSLPLVYGMDPDAAMYLLSGIIGAVACPGAITAIILNTPGTAVNAATCLDGYPMAQKGEAGRAISIAAFASLAGALFGIFILVILIPVVRTVIMSFTPPELFMLCAVGLVTATVAIKGNTIKGLISGCLGLLMASVGYSHVTALVRFNFGTDFLWDGVPLIPFFIGLFALGEMLWIISTGKETVSREPIVIKGGRVQGLKDVVKYRRCLLTSSLIGTGIGIIPGVGGSVANFVSYLFGQQFSKTPEKFGTGHPEGIVASEAANDAKDGGSLIPTLAFGLPGSAEMAVLLGGLVLVGINPGPTIMLEHLNLVWVIIIGVILANVFASTMAILLANHLAKVTRVNLSYLIPIVILLCFIGSFALRNSMLDAFTVMIFGLLGYMMRRGGFPIIPMVIGFVIGGIAENAFLQSLMISDGSYAIFFTRPISLVLFILAMFLLVLPFLDSRIERPPQTN